MAPDRPDPARAPTGSRVSSNCSDAFDGPTNTHPAPILQAPRDAGALVAAAHGFPAREPGAIVSEAPAKIDRAAIQSLAKELNRPIATLIVLENDPFYITETKQREGEWFGRLYVEHGFGRGTYLRRIDYRWASLATIVGCNGQVYENTDVCWGDLQRASLYARYLGLISSGILTITGALT